MTYSYYFIQRALCCLSFLISSFLLISCDGKDDNEPASDNKASIILSVDSYEGTGDFKSTRDMVAGNNDENMIYDIWIFQYESTTGELLREPVFSELFDLRNISIDLHPNSGNPGDEKSIVCVVANIQDDKWIYANYDTKEIKEVFKNYGTFKTQAIKIEAARPIHSANLGSKEYNIPMYGKSEELFITGKNYVNVPMKRMFAKVHTQIDVSNFGNISQVKNITYKNISRYCCPEIDNENLSTPAYYPVDDDTWWTSFDCGAVSEVTLYIPENLHGIKEGMDKKPTDTSGQTEAPEKALFIELSVEKNDGTIQTYVVYPGGNSINDFNVIRNHVYNVNIKINQ